MLIFISIFILVSLRDSVEIWTRNEIEGNRSKLVRASVRESEIWSLEKYARKKEKIHLFTFQISKNQGNSNSRISVVQRKSQIREKNHSRRERLLTFLLKCEVFREMTALVIASKEKQCGWMAQLKCPQVQYALQQSRNKKKTWFFFNHIKLDISSDTREKTDIQFLFYIHRFSLDLRWNMQTSGVKFVSSSHDEAADELLKIFPRLLISLARVERDYNNIASLPRIMLKSQQDAFASLRMGRKLALTRNEFSRFKISRLSLFNSNNEIHVLYPNNEKLLSHNFHQRIVLWKMEYELSYFPENINELFFIKLL